MVLKRKALFDGVSKKEYSALGLSGKSSAIEAMVLKILLSSTSIHPRWVHSEARRRRHDEELRIRTRHGRGMYAPRLLEYHLWSPYAQSTKRKSERLGLLEVPSDLPSPENEPDTAVHQPLPPLASIRRAAAQQPRCSLDSW